MKKTIGVVGILVAAGAAWTAASWYTGIRVEEYWEARIREVNQQLAAGTASDVSLKVDAYDRGIFSSTGRYTLNVALGEGKGGVPANVELKLVDRVQHGPFPAARLAAGHFRPVMLAAQGELLNDAVTAKWFTTAGTTAPVTADVTLSYGHEINGTLTVLPIDFSGDTGYRVKFSGTTLRIGGLDTGPHTLTGAADQFVFERRDRDGIAEQLEIQGYSLDAKFEPAWNNLQVGELNLLARTVTIGAGDSKPVTLTDLSGRVDSGHTDDKYHVHTAYKVGMVSIGGQDIAGGSVVLNADSLDPAALGELMDVHNAIMDRQIPRGQSPAPTPAELERIKHAFKALLAGNPSLAIDPLRVENDSGASLLELKLDLAAPSAGNTLLAHSLVQSIRKLDARIEVSKPQAAALLSRVLVNPSRDAAAALNIARDKVESYSRLVQAAGAQVANDKVIITVGLADNRINFNGRESTVEDFVERLITQTPSEPAGTRVD